MAPRAQIGRYEILGTLATGGMAELLLAFFKGPGGFRKYVAIKRILPSLRDQDEFVAMFLDEARISAALSHANIAQVYELGESGDELYLAMELIAGQDFSRVLRVARRANERIPVGLGAAVVRDACLALHYAHHFTTPGGRELPVIHRDLSPRNVMVTYAGNTRLIDFGIAKARGSISRTGAGQVKGSVAYMSPEQVQGMELDFASNLFSAGSLLYEALTGKRAFEGDDDVAIIFKVLGQQPVPAHELNPETPRALSKVLETAMHKDPRKRFGSGREMARAIEDACAKVIFDEEASAAWMASHFVEQMERTRKLLSAADDEAPDVSLLQAMGETANTGPQPSARPPRVEAAPAAPQVAPGSSEIRTALIAPSQVQTVLVVDDSRVGRAVVESLLSGQGFRVLAADSGAAALELLEQIDPAMIILDVRMAGMNGFELCEKIRDRPESRLTPIIFLSASCSLEERVKGLSVGGDDFIRKPFNEAELVARVRVHLKRMAMLREHTRE